MWPVLTSKGEQRICSPVRKYGEAVGPLSGHSHRRYWAVSSYPAREQIFIDIHWWVFKIRRSLRDGWSNRWVMSSYVWIPDCHKTRLRFHPNNRSRQIIRFCIFQRNLQNSGNQKSKHHQLPSGLQWNGGEIPSILTFKVSPTRMIL